jgi:hypothetical protein
MEHPDGTSTAWSLCFSVHLGAESGGIGNRHSPWTSRDGLNPTAYGSGPLEGSM